MRSRWQVTACAVVIVGVLSTDIAVAAQRSATQHHNDARAARHAAEVAYAHTVNAASRRVFAIVQPVQDGLKTSNFGVGPDLVALKDALGNADAAHSLASIDKRMHKSVAPKRMRSAAKLARTAIDEMEHSLQTLQQIGDVKDPRKIYNERYSGAADRLSEGAARWYNALHQITDRAHVTAAAAPFTPLGKKVRHAPQSRFDYIFATSRACSVAVFQQSRLGDFPKTASVSTMVSWAHHFAAIQTKLISRLRTVRRPRADRGRIVQTIVGPLHSAKTLTRAFSDEFQALQRGDAAGTHAAYSRVLIAVRALKPLARGFRVYGSTMCASYFGDPTGKRKSSVTA
jgi:hypothetical protein